MEFELVSDFNTETQTSSSTASGFFDVTGNVEGGIQGPKGDKGDIGPTGPQGDQGIQGSMGVQGPQGEQGLPGPANSLSIGGVSSGTVASATITGTAPDQTLSLVLPKGDKGDRGEVGPQGLQGNTGPRGETGPVGPQGAKGDTGAPGAQGPAGLTGPKGDQGDAGPQGPQGDTGPQGPVGPQGEVGPVGPKGDQGIQGPKGDKGDTGNTGVVISEEEPTDDDVLWYDTDDEHGNSWIESVQAGANITIDDTDPANPIISSIGGGMSADVYDPAGVQANVYNVDYHSDGVVNKVFTATHRSKLQGIESGAQVNTVSPADLAGKADLVHGHTSEDISDLSDTISSQINEAAGTTVATLSGGKVPVSQLPAIALIDVNTVGSEAAQLALVSQEGDVAIRTDINKSFIHNGGTSGTMNDWSELLVPTGGVTSVNGNTGAVTVDKASIGLSNVDNTSDVSKPVSTATQTALNAKANLSSAKGFVNHGSNASTARPTGYASVEWYGTVAPNNAATNDTWVDVS